MTRVQGAPDPLLQDELAALGQGIRQAREKQGWSLRALADYAGVGLQTLVRIERGSPGSSLENVTRVQRALGLAAVRPDAQAGNERPCHLLHVDSLAARDALERAAQAACAVLDEWLGTRTPEHDGISSNFQGQLCAHLAAMVCGEPAARRAPYLRRLAYSDSWLGGPPGSSVAACDGWVLRVRGTPVVLHGARTVLLSHPDLDPYASRAAAEQGFRAFIEAGHAPQGALDAVPVYREEGAEGAERYRF